MKGILGLMMRDWMDEYDVMLLQEPGVSCHVVPVECLCDVGAMEIARRRCFHQ